MKQILLSDIIGKQYGYRKNALRAIQNFIAKVNKHPEVNGNMEYWVNRLDEGCHEIQGRSI